MKNLFATEVENALVQIIKNNGFKFRKAKSGSLKVVLKNNYRTQHHRPDIYNTKENYMILTIGKSGYGDNECYTFRVSAPYYYCISHPWETRIGLKHWTNDVADVLTYLNTYLSKKQSTRDY